MSGFGVRLHGLRIEIDGGAGSAPVLDALAVRLGALRRDDPALEGGAPELRFEVVIGGAPATGAGRLVYEAPGGSVRYDDALDRLVVDHGEAQAICEGAAGRARLLARRADTATTWALSHPVFTVALVEMLGRRGLHALHAAGVSIDGRALLLAGTSGCGKSTLAVALGRAGCALLGDDTLLLRPSAGGVRVLGFPQAADLGDEALAFFPELARAAAAPLARGWRKRQVALGDASGAGLPLAWESRPALLVFPRLAGGEDSALAPLSRGEALLELASNVLLTEPRAAQAHLDALADLVARSDCYRLATGSDPHAAAALLVASARAERPRA